MKKTYQRLNNADDENDDRSMKIFNPQPTKQTHRYLSFFLGLLCGLILVSFAYGIFHIKFRNACTHKISNWSPALSIFTDNDFSAQRFQDALRTPNKYRGSPSPDIDDAWDEITYAKGGLTRVSKADLKKNQRVGVCSRVYGGDGRGIVSRYCIRFTV